MPLQRPGWLREEPCGGHRPMGKAERRAEVTYVGLQNLALLKVTATPFLL